MVSKESMQNESFSPESTPSPGGNVTTRGMQVQTPKHCKSTPTAPQFKEVLTGDCPSVHSQSSAATHRVSHTYSTLRPVSGRTILCSAPHLPSATNSENLREVRFNKPKEKYHRTRGARQLEAATTLQRRDPRSPPARAFFLVYLDTFIFH